jgi:hypothetical protein
LQIEINCPSTKDYIWKASDIMNPNCMIIKPDINAVEDIFGPDIGSLKEILLGKY